METDPELVAGAAGQLGLCLGDPEKGHHPRAGAGSWLQTKEGFTPESPVPTGPALPLIELKDG